MAPRGRRHRAGVLLAATLAAAAVAAWSVPVPLFVVGPGPVVPVSRVVEVVEDAAGGAALWLTTIAAQQATVGDLVRAAADPDRDIVRWADLIPRGQDLDTFLATNRRLMEESQQVAAYAAYRFLGRDAALSAAGAEVLSVRPGSPADRAGILPGDVVIAAGGRTVDLADDLSAALRDAAGGEQPWTLLREGRRVQAVVTVDQAPSPEQLGVIAVSRDLRGRFVPPVRFRRGDVSGPSAGLAFGLYLVSRLDPDLLPSGGPIAATGTLRVDGGVKPVGGVAYKARAVARAGARIFVVPAANAPEARAAAPGLRVIGVDSLAEAVAALRDAPLTPLFSHPYNDAGLEAIPVAYRHRRHSQAAGQDAAAFPPGHRRAPGVPW
ncbi:MAG TPA: PDZ domain-containing protein [Bacillota bacterium]